jgi:hypothetical protein
VEAKVMKIGNVILAIFLWLCIPASFAIGVIFGLFTGGVGGGVICAIGAPLIFFILGTIALLTGMEKTPQPPVSKPTVMPQPIQPPSSSQQETEIKETNGNEFMYNRDDIIFGIVFIGIGIIIFIAALWFEPMVDTISFPHWLFVVFRVIALISIVAGMVGIIAALIPKKQ